jgi:ribose transport system substrate-binding protein
MPDRALRVATAAGVIALAVATASCGSDDNGGGEPSGSAAEKKQIMVFSYFPRSFNDAARTWANGWDAGAEEVSEGFEVEQKATGKLETDAAAYMSFINSALVEQPDGIVVVPNDASAMQAGLKRIAGSGIDVLIQDQNPPDFDEKVAFVGTDNKKAGAQAAGWLVGQAEAGQLPSEDIAILASPPGVTSVDDRVAGFEEAAKAGGLNVVAKTADGCLEPAKARAAMADILTAHPDLGGVFSVCDLIATGAARALKAAGKLDVGLVSIDASEAAVKLIIEDGGIDAEVAQHGYEMSRLSVVTLAQALDGEQPADFVDSGTTLVTKDNAEEFLEEARRQAAG